MVYNEFGKTGKKVSAIGFGGMRFNADEYRRDILICADLVLEAYEKGITYFDTGPGYCDDQSEMIFGEAFKQMRYGDFYVSTKCGLWQATDADGTRRMIEQSLKRMNVPKLTFYNMWCIRHFDEYTQMIGKGGMLDGIHRAKEEGLVEHVCCTIHLRGDEIERIVGDGLMEGVTIGYNATNFSYRRSGLLACKRNNVGVVVMNPLGGGAIPNHPEYFSFLKGGSPDSLAVSALKFLVAHDEITVTLPGISSSAELNEALLATKNLPRIDEAYLGSLSDKLREEMETLCTCCSYCDQCPEGVPVHKLVESYNETIFSGGKDLKDTLSRLNIHWSTSPNEAKKCTECGRCEGLCTQKLPIIERLRAIAAVCS